MARSQVRADERKLRPKLTLRGALAEFVRHPTPWMIAVFLLGSTIARVLVGDWTRGDALVPAIMVASFPLTEWLIHVFILHWRPKKLGPVTADSLLARKHREHHRDPRNLPLIFIPWQVLCVGLPLAVPLALLAFGRAGLGLTFLVTLSVLGLIYEWTHYLIHTDYKPRSRFYRATWRSHRFHHYKNENYWFTVTTAGTADRLLRTFPDPDSIEKSPTAKNLHSLG